MKTCSLCGNATISHLGVYFEVEVETDVYVETCRDCYDKALGR